MKIPKQLATIMSIASGLESRSIIFFSGLYFIIAQIHEFFNLIFHIGQNSA
jgi:hypothetical protein